MNRFVLALACAGVIAVWVWVAIGTRSKHSVDPALPAITADASNETVSKVEDREHFVSERRPTSHEPRIEGRVLSTEGRPLSGALVRLKSLASRSAGAENEDLEFRCLEDGSFAFDKVPDLSPGAVLLASADGFAIGGADIQDEGGVVEIRLDARQSIEVRVLDLAAKPTAGARVVHEPILDGAAEATPRWLQFLETQAVTAADGIVRLPAITDAVREQRIRAYKDGLASKPWCGPNPSRIELRLGSSFTLEGRLSYSEPTDPRGCRVRVLGLDGNLWRTLATLEEVGEGSWGPLLVPLDGISRYRVRAEGGSIVPIEEAFDPPRRDVRHRVDLFVTTGLDLELTVVDPTGDRVETATGFAWWGESAQPDGVRVSLGRRVVPGHIRIGGLPGGFLQYRIEAPGFAFFEYWAELPQKEPIEVTLARGGRIVGRCLHQGEPVQDFEVIYWKEGNPRLDQRRAFFGRADGRFEIDYLAAGGWFLYAASPAYPSGAPTAVRVRADEATEVELELPEALAGGGRVLDAESGAGIGGARIQAFSSGGTEMSFPWGPPVQSSEDGTFELSAFVPGSNFIRVDADGFASSFAKASVEPEGFLDWGDIRLHRPQRLRLSLLGLDEDGGYDPTGFRSGTSRGHILPQQAFDRDGRLVFEGVPPGAHELFVYYPDGPWARLQLQLEPGRDWDYDFKVAGARELDLVVLDAAGERLPFTVMVMVVAQEESGVLVVRMAVTLEDGTLSFGGLRTDKAQVWIYDWDQKTIGSRDVDLVANAGRRVEIRLDGKPLRARIIDRDGAPVAGASISMRSAAGDEILGAQITDTDGWASFFGLPAKEVLMDVGHGRLGRRFGVPVDASQDEIEFVLDADGALELELRDGDVPLAGVAVEMQTESGVRLSESKQTGADGRVRFEPLGEGRYHLACRRADCWPATVTHALSASEQASVPFQMRRLADLVLAVTSAAGLPVSAVPVELAPLDLEGDVARWIEEGRVRAPGGLATDVRGALRISGLPRGAYSWSVETAEGPLSGTFELLPASENTVRVVLPE